MIEYTVVRSRRKTLAIEITPRGEILVRAPVRMAKGDIQSFVDSRRDWICTHLEKLGPAPNPLTPEDLRQLSVQAKLLIPEKVARYATLLGVTFGRIAVRSQRRRWGSCSARGNLNFNCLLMLAPEEILDYVIVHELCHRKEMNHSPRFWALVEQILPDYRSRRKWLTDHGANLLARLPDAQK